MKKQKVVILGSTGSIGTQAIDVIKTVGDKEIIGLACDGNVEKIYKQVIETKAKYVCIFDEEKAEAFRERCKTNRANKNVFKNLKIYSGIEGLETLTRLKEADMVIISVVGMIGIRPTIEAVKAKKIICLANKESLVCAGDIIMPLAKKLKVEIRPIDSEHSAIWQSIVGEKKETIKKIIITASGGPFFGKKLNDLKKVKIEEALNHPNWSMGKKITIDSSTLVNKGLEIIEAHHLFDMPYDKIEVVVQRESLIHSMVEFVDGAIKAELGVPSMRVPIEYAIYRENRKFINENVINWKKLNKISIGTPDLKTFKGLKLAYDAIRIGGLMPSVYNALNEVAVRKYINDNLEKNNKNGIINKEKFKYLDIVKFIEKGMKKFEKEKLNKKRFTVEDIEKTMEFAKGLT